MFAQNTPIRGLDPAKNGYPGRIQGSPEKHLPIRGEISIVTIIPIRGGPSAEPSKQSAKGINQMRVNDSDDADMIKYTNLKCNPP